MIIPIRRCDVRNRLIRIDFSNHLPHRTHETHGITRRANREIARYEPGVVSDLTIRQVHLGFHGLVDTHLPHICDDANYRGPGPVRVWSTDLETTSERILAGPVLARHLLVDDRDWKRILVVSVGEITSLAKRDVHRLEVIGSHLTMSSIVSHSRNRFADALGVKTAAPTFP
jgi:hypothetical protein